MVLSASRFAMLLSLPLILAGTSFAQPNDPPTEDWAVRYNGPGSGNDTAVAIAVDGSGNVYVTGQSIGSGTATDYATIKYNSAGAPQWVARYNGPGNLGDYACDIVVDDSGNVYVTGYSRGSGTQDDYATIKYSSSGTQQWVARYNGPGSGQDRARSIAIDSSGNVYVTGYSAVSSLDVTTIRYSPAGTQQWVQFYNGPGNGADEGWDITVDGSGNSYVTGYSDGGSTSEDIVVIKYNSAGTQAWASRYNGPENEGEVAEAIAVDGSGSVYVTGECAGSGGTTDTNDYVTAKYNSAGAQQWVQFYAGPGNDYDTAQAIAVDGSGNVYVTGFSRGSGTQDDYATIKYNSAGTQQWVQRYNGPGNADDQAFAIALDGSANVYVCGYSNNEIGTSDYATVKYNSSGTQQWVVLYDGPDSGFDRASALAVDGFGNVCVTGHSESSGVGLDYATIKYIQNTGIEDSPGFEFAIEVYPNPLSTTTSVIFAQPEPSECSILIYGLDGRLVETLYNGPLSGGQHSFIWQASSFPAGVYLVRASAGSQEYIARVVLLR